MNLVKLCIFDMDGLLLDTERYMWLVNGLKSGKHFGYDIEEEFLKSIMGQGLEAYRTQLQQHLGPEFPVMDYYQYLLKLNYEMIENNEIKTKNGVVELLRFLKKKHIPCAVGTSTFKEMAIKMLTNTGIIEYFDLIVCRDEVKNGKPAPDIFLKAAEHFDISPEYCMVFEDGHPGCRAAISAGMKLMVVPDIAKLQPEDFNEAYKVLNCIDETIDVINNL